MIEHKKDCENIFILGSMEGNTCPVEPEENYAAEFVLWFLALLALISACVICLYEPRDVIVRPNSNYGPSIKRLVAGAGYITTGKLMSITDDGTLEVCTRIQENGICIEGEPISCLSGSSTDCEAQ